MSKELLWKPYDPANLLDPYPMYKRLRDTDPVHQAQTGEWVITRYEDVKFILKSHSSFRSGNRFEWLAKGIKYFENYDEDLRPIHAAVNSFVLFLNPPLHGAVRTLINRVWSEKDAEDQIRKNVELLLNQIKDKEFDLVKDFAQLLPVLTISNIMGIPTDEYRHLRNLGIIMIRSMDLYHNYKDLVELSSVSKQFVEYFQDQYRLKVDRPDSSLMSNMIQANLKEKIATEEQLISVFIFLFIAGEESTAGSIGSGFYRLIKGNKYSELQSGSVDLTIAAEELMRFDTPVQFLGRIAKEPVEVGGKTIPKDAGITLIIGAANHDPEIFDNPDELILSRTPNRHLSFGYGNHFCMGDWLGRQQQRLAIEGILHRYKSMQLAEQDLRWNKNLSVRSLTSLMVKVE